MLPRYVYEFSLDQKLLKARGLMKFLMLQKKISTVFHRKLTPITISSLHLHAWPWICWKNTTKNSPVLKSSLILLIFDADKDLYEFQTGSTQTSTHCTDFRLRSTCWPHHALWPPKSKKGCQRKKFRQKFFLRKKFWKNSYRQSRNLLLFSE